MHSRFFAIPLGAIAISGLAACSTPDFGEQLQAEGAAITSLGEQWEKGAAMQKRGAKLVEKGQKRIAEGENLIAEGESLMASGRALQRESEIAYLPAR